MKGQSIFTLALFCLQAGLFAATPEIELQRDSSATEDNYYQSNNQNTKRVRQEESNTYQIGQSRPYTTIPQSSTDTNRFETNGSGTSSYYREARSSANYNSPTTGEFRSQTTTPSVQTTSNRFMVKEQEIVLPNGVERTLSIIKPDAVETKHIGDILSRFEKAGLKIVALKLISLTPEQARQFYAVHRDRPFYDQLVQYMTSGPVVVVVLEGKNAIAKNRHMMGKTNPQQADAGTIRADFGESITRNAIHGSDSPETATEEIRFFFQPNELVNYSY